MRYAFLEDDTNTKIADADRPVIREAIRLLADLINEGGDCFQFTEVADNSEKLPTLMFYSGTGCHSAVGMSGGTQMLSLGRGCLHSGYIWHELLHALGLWHEHTRLDRDKYVRILWQNIEPDAQINFQITAKNKINDLGTPYDLSSLMHYPDNYFSKNGLKKTILPKEPGIKIGQRDKPSYWDIKRIRILYECDTV
ncbi:high choriolytic enzyme 1-like [Tubulanus polymorphus]|uniref:high choriolytic enzyme 1-like n=1 Tax=Tubulanus polymorphus TaxID=672921 RepID=UPI003DA3B1FE